MNVTAVDISKTMLKYMQKKIDRSRPATPINMVNDIYPEPD